MGIEEQLSTRSCLTELCRLAEYYGTDKLGVYTPFYDLLFSARREKVYKVLEVGIGTPTAMAHVPNYCPGASLRMWKDYFPNAEIHGIDKDAAAVNTPFGDRILTHRVDQSYEADLLDALPALALGGKFDLIVDDGSHKPEDQLLTFQVLSKLLDPRGLYIIEDIYPPGPWFDFPHTEIHHWHEGIRGHAILIRGEAIHG
jgi:hypothetical protein